MLLLLLRPLTHSFFSKEGTHKVVLMKTIYYPITFPHMNLIHAYYRSRREGDSERVVEWRASHEGLGGGEEGRDATR
jgi:hypothetical protein